MRVFDICKDDAVLVDKSVALSALEPAVYLDFVRPYPPGGGYEKIWGMRSARVALGGAPPEAAQQRRVSIMQQTHLDGDRN